MHIAAIGADERVRDVSFSEDTFTVELMDGRSITTPLAWFPRLLHATPRGLFVRLLGEVTGAVG